MLNRRHFISLFLCLMLSGALLTSPVGASAAASPAEAEQDVETFVGNLANKTFRMMSDKSMAHSERMANFRGLLKNSFAIDSIGKWVLGRFWRKASSAERAEYLRLFEDMILTTYADRFRANAGERLSITRSISHGGGKFTVYSKFIRSGGGNPISVDWRLGRKDGRFLVVDVMIQGVSMSTTLRSEFASTIRRAGNGVNGLLEVMRAKTATLRLSAGK